MKTLEEKAEEYARIGKENTHEAEQAFIEGYTMRDGESQWVSVEERLPEDGEYRDYSINVLCLFDNQMQYVLSFIKHEDNKGKFYLNIGSAVFEDITDTVTHWMPLPNLPQPPKNN